MSVKYLILFALLMFSSLPLVGQEPVVGHDPAGIFLAKDDGKGKPGDSATTFSTTDSPIHCVVNLGDMGPATVKMYLVAVGVSGLKPDLRVVSASYTTSEGQNQVFFNGRPQKAWLPGTYRADIFVDGKPFRSLDFVVTAPKPTPGGNSFAPKSSIVKPRRSKTKPN
jgi:hypothetical protein